MLRKVIGKEDEGVVLAFPLWRKEKEGLARREKRVQMVRTEKHARMRNRNGHFSRTGPFIKEMIGEVKRWKFLGFAIASSSVFAFFFATWLSPWWSVPLDTVYDNLGYFLYLIWFVCYFLVSFLSLKAIIKKHLFVKCAGIALLLTLFTYVYLVILSIILAPYLEPMF